MPRRVVVLSFAVAAAACSSTATTTSVPPPPTVTIGPTTVAAPPGTAAAPTTTSTSQPEPVEAFTLDAHVAWFVGLLNGDAPAEADYEARFDEGFRGAIAYEVFTAPFAQLAGEWAITSEDRAADGSASEVLLVPAAGPKLLATFTREDGPAGRLSGLVIQPAGLDDSPETLDSLAARWSELALRAVFLVADESCMPVAGDATGGQFAIGSVFKLWVLHALAEAVADGSAAWDEPLPVRDDLKSLPSGTMQDEPAGKEFTLEEHARLMISISDNTATDHLIHRLGRPAVEAAVADTGHAEPDRNRPFFTTRELFWLKLVAPGDVVAAYVGGDEAGRRAVLDEADIDLAKVEPPTVTDPVHIETLEWFASVVDVCEVLTSLLDDFGATPVPDILTANPGVRVDTATWPQVAFKGGSEPGVLALAWHATRADGEEFVIVGILNDPESPVDQITAVLLAEAAFELLAGP